MKRDAKTQTFTDLQRCNVLTSTAKVSHIGAFCKSASRGKAATPHCGHALPAQKAIRRGSPATREERGIL